MVHKNKLPRLLIALTLVSGSAIADADCYLRSASVSRAAARIERMADLQYALLPAEGNQMRCRVTFRALIDNQWHTAEGENVGPAKQDSAQICSQALNIARSTTLVRVSDVSTQMAQEMVCTDQPIPKVRESVAAGEAVRESELQPHPIYRRPFSYRGSMCKWFVESRPDSGRVDMNQGVICKAPNDNAWRVVDKW